VVSSTQRAEENPLPAKAPYKVTTQSFSLPAALLGEVKEQAKLRDMAASALVREALEAHLVNLRLDIDAERMKANAPGGERRELAEVAPHESGWTRTHEKGNRYLMGRIAINLNRPMTKKMTDALIEPFQRCIAAAWVAEAVKPPSCAGGSPRRGFADSGTKELDDLRSIATNVLVDRPGHLFGM
jgi:hypothetical protein